MTSIQLTNGFYGLDHGQTFSFTDETGFVLVGSSNNNDPMLFNDATINVLSDNSNPVAAVAVSGFSLWPAGYFINAPDGVITVTGTSASATVYGFKADNPSPSVFNSGLMQISSAGQAYGLVDLAPGYGIVNNAGTLMVSGAIAAGVVCGSLDNGGTIQVDGSQGASGVRLGLAPSFLSNRGVITVHDLFGDAVGVSFEDLTGSATINNLGAISADIAIISHSQQASLIINNGTIDGVVDVSLETHSGQIHNTGSINGDVRLGSVNDFFDGAAGHYSGRISGNAGDDVIMAGAGDAALDGGSGNDTINGGIGDDTAVYRGPSSAYSIAHTGILTIVTDLASGFSEGTDTLVHLEHLKFTDQTIDVPDQAFVGSDFTGDFSADILWRNAGNGDVYLWTSSGAAVAAPGQDLGIESLTSQVQAAADFNGDSKADILWRDTTTGDAYLWTSSGAAIAAPGIDLGIVPLNWQIIAPTII